MLIQVEASSAQGYQPYPDRRPPPVVRRESTQKKRAGRAGPSTQGTEGSITTLKHCLNQLFETAPAGQMAPKPIFDSAIQGLSNSVTANRLLRF
ncbi:hypothetical protein BTW07_07285 [Salinicola socius]|uniref:Uncharacterized protein n=1 Tax=Salinicola socius TaxID=404433 RepID=A0A1Q8ST65_9GAMM|nr:hypothetical protein BTW07_07285 [Salinicola socius]